MSTLEIDEIVRNNFDAGINQAKAEIRANAAKVLGE